MMPKKPSKRISRKFITWSAIAIAFCAVTLVFIVWAYHYTFGEDISNKVNEIVVEYERLNLRVVMRARTLGIGGNTEIAVFEEPYSVKPSAGGMLSRELLSFRGVTELYYKKQDESTLIIYVSSDGVLQDRKMRLTKLKIVLNELKNYDELNKYESNYRQYGLSRISVYEK